MGLFGKKDKQAKVISMEKPNPSSVLSEDDKKRGEACTNEINAVLRKYNCRMVPMVLLSSTGVIQSSCQVFPNLSPGQIKAMQTGQMQMPATAAPESQEEGEAQ